MASARTLETHPLLLSWGGNANGQCCTGEDGEHTERRPRVVNARVNRALGLAAPVAAVAAGEAHTLLLTVHGDVFSCGRAREGQLGLGAPVATGEVRFPQRVEALRPWRVVQVACGSKHCVAVTADGVAFEWGLLLPAAGSPTDEAWVSKRSGLGKDFQEDLNERQQRIVAASWSRYLRNSAESGLGPDLGHDGYDKDAAFRTLVGAEAHRSASHAPRPCAGVGGPDGGPRAVAASCGFAHSVVAVDDGQLLAGGYGEKGQLGRGDRSHSASFLPVLLPTGTSAAARSCLGGGAHPLISCGLNHTAAVLLPDFQLYTWGLGVFGQLGLGPDKKEQNFPSAVQLPGPVAQVACGEHHTIVLTAQGDVLGFGHRDAVGGHSHSKRRPERKPALSAGSGRLVEQLYAGGTSCFASVRDECEASALWSWGYNQHFQLGRHVAQLQLLSPGGVALPRLASSRVRSMGAGAGHAVLALDAPGSAVLPAQAEGPFFGSAPLLEALSRDSDTAHDVLVVTGGRSGDVDPGRAPLRAHQCVLRARCAALATRLRAPRDGAAAGTWELDLHDHSEACASALLEYIYTDYCRATNVVAAELRPLAEALGLDRLVAGIAAATETDSADASVKWVRTAAGQWQQLQVSSRKSDAAETPSTYVRDLEALVVPGGGAEGPDFVEFLVGTADGQEESPQRLGVAKLVLLSAEYFRAMLKGGFAESEFLHSGPVQLLAGSAEALVLCLRAHATGNFALLPEDSEGLLAVLAEAHRLELPGVLAAAEAALAKGAAADDLDVDSAATLARAAALYGLPKIAHQARRALGAAAASGAPVPLGASWA